MTLLVARIAASLARTVAAVVMLSIGAIAVGVIAFGVGGPFATALYFTLWWTLLFLALPFAARSQAASGEITEGTDPGAPAAPLLREKAIWTTLMTAPVFLALCLALPLVGP